MEGCDNGLPEIAITNFKMVYVFFTGICNLFYLSIFPPNHITLPLILPGPDLRRTDLQPQHPVLGCDDDYRLKSCPLNFKVFFPE